MATRYPLAVDEWYHCYNRGVDKRRVFNSKTDYERLLLLMYAGGKDMPAHISNLRDRRLINVLSDKTLGLGSQIVEIGSYALMPNHFHFVLKEIREGGIALFMQKVFTGYTIYFNKKNNRTGALFAGTYKSRHVADDRYLKHLISYVHTNPVELYAPGWKDGSADLPKIEEYLRRYPYSSLPEFIGEVRPHKQILNNSIFQLFEKMPSIQTMLREARTYEALNL
jgi:putative transposase